MVRNLLIVLVLILSASSALFAQSGALKGKILDKSTKEPIPFANVVVENNGTQAGGGTSNIDGEYTIKPLNPGKYDVKASFVGYKPVLIRGMVIHSEKIEFQNIEMEPTATELQTYEVIDYKVPLISKDNTASGASITAEEIAKMPIRNVSAVTASIAGVFSRDGEIGSMRGQRSEGNVMYIDGIRVRGSQSLPESAIEQISVILGGLPAQYGDATGGVINVTTKGPSRQFGGGLELQTSEYLDPYGYNRAGFNLTGPIFWNKERTYSTLGYFAAVDVEYKKDGSPLALGMYKLNDEKLAEIEANPLTFDVSRGIHQTADHVRASDLVKLKSTLNSKEFNVNSSLKLDVKSGKNSTLTFGGSYNSYKTHDYDWLNSIFNYNRNSLSNGNTWRVFGRFTQRFPVEKESTSLIKNVFYSLQADYTSIYAKTQDEQLKDNLFAYGYVGKFSTYKTKAYDRVDDTLPGGPGYHLVMNGFADTLVTFDRSELNPIAANYTSDFYKLFNDLYGIQPYNTDLILAGNGLLNGYTPGNVEGGVNGLFAAPGTPQAGYSISDSKQFTANVNLSGDVGNHEIKLGFTFEKLTSSSYSYAPTSFWPIMTLLTNSHIIQLDYNDPIEYSVPIDTATSLSVTDYHRLYDGNSQRAFDRNLRTLMGLPVNGTDWIDVNSYDINSQTINYFDEKNVLHTATLNKPLSVDLFSADELLNDGNEIAFARGYDYYGNKFARNHKPSIDDFFNATNDQGDKLREIAPVEPVYMAGFIQDKFSFDDLVFNIGFRLDRFDANQSVLKDPYTLYPAKTVKEVTNLGTIPSSMGPDYVVYVNDLNNPTSIMGFRNGTNWYDATGTGVLDPTTKLDAGNGVIPYLQDPSSKEITGASFSDYTPQLTLMPRISFSFPISDVALFYAHYDVLTKRPTNYTFSPLDYLFWPTTGNPTMNNPNLKPEKTVDYELGFQQKISNSSSLNISGFYREFRDQIQSFRYTGAYPKTYYSYGNIDFGTVKGLSVSYDLRRTINLRLRASYTLQFANGTGSNSETSSSLIRSGQPNLRTLLPYDYDQRHQFKIDVDFRYGEGTDYNGPIVAGKQILKNAGFNITLNGGSGTPYTRSSRIYPLGAQTSILGSINGSRLPGSFRFDGRVDKDFTVSTKKDAKGNSKEIYLNVYLQVLNILNSQNIMGVYAATGNPDDDGYLAAAEWQNQINSQIDTQSFIDLYRIRVNNPYNYSQPRMIRLGVGINF